MFDNIWLDRRHAPFNTTYLQRILRVINNATAEHARTMAVRVKAASEALCKQPCKTIHPLLESLWH